MVLGTWAIRRSLVPWWYAALCGTLTVWLPVVAAIEGDRLPRMVRAVHRVGNAVADVPRSWRRS